MGERERVTWGVEEGNIEYRERTRMKEKVIKSKRK
jgi:hypothetical protein